MKFYKIQKMNYYLSLIYRSYWATDKEKQEFAIKDQQERNEKEQRKKEEYQGKNIYQVFEERKNMHKITLDNNLMVIKKESFIRKWLNTIVKLFKK